MNLILMDTDIGNELDLLTGKISTQSWKDANVHVFANNIAPSRSDALGTYTEATFPGYAAVGLVGATWPFATVGSHIASAVYGALITFTRSTTGSPETVYGVYVTNSTNTTLLGAALFDSGPYVLQNAGDKVDETLTLTLESKYS